MLTKLAGFILAGSLATLTVAGIAGVDDDWGSHGRHERRHRQRRAMEHREHVRNEIRREIRREVRGGNAHDDVLGTYSFKADGNVLGKFPWRADVQLDLQDDNRYELRVTTHLDGETESETTWGRYDVEGDQVVLYSAHDDERHEFNRAGNRLEFSTGFKEKLALKAVGIQDAAFIKH